MALAECRACGRAISWEDFVCPHCGAGKPVTYPWDASNRRGRGRGMVRQTAGVIATAIVLLSLLAFCSSVSWESLTGGWGG